MSKSKRKPILKTQTWEVVAVFNDDGQIYAAKSVDPHMSRFMRVCDAKDHLRRLYPGMRIERATMTVRLTKKGGAK